LTFENGYEGLKPRTRSDNGKLKAISREVLERAAELKQELPERSVRRIIRILEGEGTIKKRRNIPEHPVQASS